MAVRKKGLRSVNFRGRRYYWHVNESNVHVPEEGLVTFTVTRRVLHIIGAKKQFIVHYHIPHKGESGALLVVEGPLFPRQPGAGEVWLPRWRHDSKRYPTADFVRRLINWCMAGGESS